MRSIRRLRHQPLPSALPIQCRCANGRRLVTQVIEQNMNGLDGLMYMSSTSDAAGNASITLTFETGTSPDIAQVQVQNKLQLATPSLPEAVQQQGLALISRAVIF
ncbi:efflux RND transporter permease subunit [Escherichia coli]